MYLSINFYKKEGGLGDKHIMYGEVFTDLDTFNPPEEIPLDANVKKMEFAFSDRELNGDPDIPLSQDFKEHCGNAGYNHKVELFNYDDDDKVIDAPTPLAGYIAYIGNRLSEEMDIDPDVLRIDVSSKNGSLKIEISLKEAIQIDEALDKALQEMLSGGQELGGQKTPEVL